MNNFAVHLKLTQHCKLTVLKEIHAELNIRPGSQISQLEPLIRRWQGERRALKAFCCSVPKLCPTLCNPMDYSTPAPAVLHCPLEFAQIHVRWVSDVTWPSHPLPPSSFASIVPSIRVFSSEPALCMRWPKYWNFSFSISPSNEYSGLISFRIDWFDLLAVQGSLQSIPQHYSLKALKVNVPWEPVFHSNRHMI